MKCWITEKIVHLGIKTRHKYTGAYCVYATITHATNEPKEFLARVLDEYGETEKTQWFESLEEAKKYIIKTCKFRYYKALNYKDISIYYKSKLYFYDKKLNLIDIFRNLDDFLRRYDARINYAKSIFVKSRNHIPRNDTRLNYLSIVKFNEKYDRRTIKRIKTRST
jgi:hypothetical protein